MPAQSARKVRNDEQDDQNNKKTKQLSTRRSKPFVPLLLVFHSDLVLLLKQKSKIILFGLNCFKALTLKMISFSFFLALYDDTNIFFSRCLICIPSNKKVNWKIKNK